MKLIKLADLLKGVSIGICLVGGYIGFSMFYFSFFIALCGLILGVLPGLFLLLISENFILSIQRNELLKKQIKLLEDIKNKLS